MSVVIEIRNPRDLTDTYDQIEIQRATANLVASMADIKTDLAISSTYATDLSSGYTAYTDPSGTAGTHYYRFRYKNAASGAVSSYSDIFLSGTSVIHNQFRRMMRDTNSNDYFFTNDDLDFFLTHAIGRLWPITWTETYSDSAFVPNGTTKIFNFPTGVTRVNSLELIDSGGVTQGILLNWKVRGRTLIFEEAPSSGLTIRAWLEKMFLSLSEVPDVWDSHILNLMKLQAYEMMEADRSKYYKYTSTVQPEGGSLPSLDKIIVRLERQITNREIQLKRSRRPANIRLV